jgi:hypothetical protein
LLAGHLGRTRRELLESLDAVELREWQAVYRLTRFGDVEAEKRIGELTSTIINYRPFGKGRRDFTAEDIFPRLNREAEVEKPEQSEAEMRRNMEMFVTWTEHEFGNPSAETPAE